jgi:hypothetical protein
MKAAILASLIALGLPVIPAQAQDSGAKTTVSPCSITQKGAGTESVAPGGLSASASAGGSSTSVTVGGGHASATTTVPAGSVASSNDVGRTRVTVKPGSSVVVQSGTSGSGSAAAAIASDGQVTVLSSGDGCVVTIEPRG